MDGYLKALSVKIGIIGEAIKHKVIHNVLIFLQCLKLAKIIKIPKRPHKKYPEYKKIFK
jgi:hypothetical protein